MTPSRLEDIPTPALVVDVPALDRNIARMARFFAEGECRLRPHVKAHKTPEIAKYLISHGAVGTCAAKLSEAEVFAAHGVRGILITTAVIGRHKIERAVRLAAKAPDTIFSVDNAQNARDLS